MCNDIVSTKLRCCSGIFLFARLNFASLRFESSVISYGSETIGVDQSYTRTFESSVISYGSETYLFSPVFSLWFESSVISYGSETR